MSLAQRLSMRVDTILKITAIRELTVPLEGKITNSVVSFAEHTVSLVAVICDVMRNGKPVIGIDSTQSVALRKAVFCVTA